MLFEDFAGYLSSIEKTASRLEITRILAELFTQSSPTEVKMEAYLLMGSVAPPYEQRVFGIAERLMVRAVAAAYSRDDGSVRRGMGQSGDLGIVGEHLRGESNFLFAQTHRYSIQDVFDACYAISTQTGDKSQERKRAMIVTLLQGNEPLSVRYIIRILLSTLRLRFSAMTILDAYSWMISGGKGERSAIERAYNVYPDLGELGRVIRHDGAVKRIEPQVGVPILMARAERVKNTEEIIEKIGECAIEPKYDGFRLQLHYSQGRVQLFTRSMENVTGMYPDIVAQAVREIRAESVIIEGEAIGYNPTTGTYLPFQETVQRKRKYDISTKAREVPLTLFAFDILLLNGESVLAKPYKERRHLLAGVGISTTEMTVCNSAKEIATKFTYYCNQGLEGIMAKRLEGKYEAGARGWNWIKFKRSYSSRIQDTIDGVVMGYYHGRGKRSDFGLGAFLIGILDGPDYLTVAKIGTGLTDEEWKQLKNRIDDYNTAVKPPEYKVEKTLVPDVWVTPSLVVEVRADEVTRSPVHSSGYALRFPRLEHFRDDKKPTDATTLRELLHIVELQNS